MNASGEQHCDVCMSIEAPVCTSIVSGLHAAMSGMVPDRHISAEKRLSKCIRRSGSLERGRYGYRSGYVSSWSWQWTSVVRETRRSAYNVACISFRLVYVQQSPLLSGERVSAQDAWEKTYRSNWVRASRPDVLGHFVKLRYGRDESSARLSCGGAYEKEQ
jgi:hypothetical protein